MQRPFPRKAIAAAIVVLLLLLLAWWLFSRKDAPPPEAAQPLAEFGAPMPMAVALCPGMQIVTAISTPDGDYESIKTIEAITGAGVHIRYSSEGRVGDVFADNYGQMRRTSVSRFVRAEDIASATFYAHRWFEGAPETIPQSTAIGTSANVLRDVKANLPDIKFGVSNAYSGDPGIDREVRPNIYDYITHGVLTLVSAEPVVVLMDDRLALLPAVQARGEFIGEAAEFSFLDDERNPLTLAFTIGIRPDGAGRPPETLNLVKIANACGGDGPKVKEAELAELLRVNGRAAVYDVHFAFGTGEVREESAKRIGSIAEILAANPGWRLRIEGHTDTVGDAAANLALSTARAEGLKAALVARGVDAGRLEAVGLGGAHPRADNATAEGRARNRRIEIQRL